MTKMEHPTEVEDEYCSMCGFSKTDHHFKHKFVGIGGSLQVADSSGDQAQSGDPVTQGRAGIDLRGDPVLRMALIRKGVLTTGDLDTVEHELRTAGIVSTQTVVKSGHS